MTRFVGWGVLLLAITLVVFLVVEGLASSVLFVRHLQRSSESVVMTEERHTDFDSELGWVSVPGIELPDLYGQGKGLTTNDRGFRGRERVPVSPASGKRRVICSGDSFTLGHGVSDEATWCARLSELDPTLKTVNMGQGGYGIGQAFLWHARDGADLERSIHVLAVIGDDFNRLASDHFLGFDKPLLRLEGDELVVDNVPVQRRSDVRRWLAQNGALFRELRAVRLLRGILYGERGDTSTERPDREATWAVASAVFDSLEADNAARGARLVLLFIPVPWDYRTELYDDWRARARAYAERTGVTFIDLVEELREMNRKEANSLFIPWGEIGAPHLNEDGNAWVARRLWESAIGPILNPEAFCRP